MDGIRHPFDSPPAEGQATTPPAQHQPGAQHAADTDDRTDRAAREHVTAQPVPREQPCARLNPRAQVQIKHKAILPVQHQVVRHPCHGSDDHWNTRRKCLIGHDTPRVNLRRKQHDSRRSVVTRKIGLFDEPSKLDINLSSRRFRLRPEVIIQLTRAHHQHTHSTAQLACDTCRDLKHKVRIFGGDESRAEHKIMDSRRPDHALISIVVRAQM